MKKLLTITKSKFYMLRVNFPKAFEVSVDRDNHLSNSEEYDPLADKKPAVAENITLEDNKSPWVGGGAVDLDEDETEENKKKRAE